MRTLHWSVSPIDGDESPFVACVQDALRQQAERPTEPQTSLVSRYRIICRSRNFYRWGILNEGEESHGEWTVARRHRSGQWDYATRMLDRMSGEETMTRFAADQTPERSLIGGWTISSRYENDHGNPGRMHDYSSTGRLMSDGDLQMRLAGGLEFSAGRVAQGSLMLADATLLDSIQAMAGREFCLLDRLECLRPSVRMQEIGCWDCPLLEGASRRLRGYAMYGEGVDPRYYWLDENGVVLFIGTTQNVYVLDSVRTAADKDFPEPVAPSARNPDACIGKMNKERPNILFINTDQQTWDAMGGTNPQVRTPALDFLITQGISFLRSYTTDPVCCPARSSWTTGRYSSETNCVLNGSPIHSDLPDIAQLLRGAGDYLPVHVGKWHVDGRHLPERSDFQLLYFGRRHIGASAGESHDPSSVRAVLGFLDQYDGNEPFYLEVGLVDPHDICELMHLHEENAIPDPVALGLVEESQLPELPANFSPKLEELNLHKAVHRRGLESLIHPRFYERAKTWSERDWRGFAWNYYRHVERADQHIGILLAALQSSRFRENTLVIFSVDHGEAAGRHRCIQKFSLYEEAIRVPFIVAEFGNRFGVAKSTVDEEHSVSGVDLVPTILDYAAVKSPVRLSGRSLRPVIEGRKPEDWPDYAYVESNIYSRAIVGRRFKYLMEYLPHPEDPRLPPRMQTHQIGRELLFDLTADPGETRDVAGLLPREVARCREVLRRHEEKLENRRFSATSYPNTLIEDWHTHFKQHLAKAGHNPKEQGIQ